MTEMKLKYLEELQDCESGVKCHPLLCDIVNTSVNSQNLSLPGQGPLSQNNSRYMVDDLQALSHIEGLIVVYRCLKEENHSLMRM